MLFVLSLVLVALTGLMILGLVLGTQTYVAWFRAYCDVPVGDADLPAVAIVLSLRGADPSLVECLKRLATLDYPIYETHIVVDNVVDPAHAVVQNWISEHPTTNVRVHVLREISAHAYLKTSAIRQCLKELPQHLAVAVMVDADTLVYSSWLRDMVLPMANNQHIGLVTGNRWYDPTRTSWGSRVRFIYNANSVIAMYFMNATWGGSLAIRREVFAQDYFAERMWDTSSEESAMQDATRRAGLQLAVTPMVMILNRESTTWQNCFHFIRRQLVWTRLYHRNWSIVVVGSILAYVNLAAIVVLAFYHAWIGNRGLATILTASIIAVIGANMWMMELLHHEIASRAKIRDRTLIPPFSFWVRMRLLAALPLALLTYTSGVVSACFARVVQWRGITYRVRPPHKLELVEYQPYVEANTTSEPKQSIV